MLSRQTPRPQPSGARMGAMNFEVRKRLEAGDYGEEVGEGFFMADLGKVAPTPGPTMKAPGMGGIKPKTRAQRIQYADGMAAQLMDYYMEPATLNDNSIINPIRDGIPQCRAHPFVTGDATRFGCIHGCGNRERDAGGNLPVAREGTLGDAWEWVRALIQHAVLTQDKRLGYSAGGPDLTRS